MASPLAGRVQLEQGVAVVTLLGEIDLASVPVLTELLELALGLGAPRVTVDLTDVSFLDASGLGVLVGVASDLREDGLRLGVRGASEWVKRVVEVTGLTQALGSGRRASSDALERGLQRSAEGPAVRDVLDAALKLVVVMAQAVVRSADGVSITLPRQGELRTVAASNDVVLQMDHDQYDTGQGPCLDAATQGLRFQVEALGDEGRWPDFVPRARARGIESILSTPLVASAVPVGALNVYSRRVRAFAEHETRWTDQFASEAALVVQAAGQAVSLPLVGQVRQALASRQVIAVAQGFVAHRDGVSAREAFVLLRRQSTSEGRPIREVCEALLRTVADGSPRGPER